MNELEALWHWLLRGLGIEDADASPVAPLQLAPGPPSRLTQVPGGPLTILSPVAPGDVHVTDEDAVVAPAYRFLTSAAWGAPERAALLALQRGLGLEPSVGGLAGVIQHETGGVPNLPTDAQIAAERARSGGKSTPRGGLTQITVGAHVPGYDTADKVRAIRAMPITAQLAAGGPIDLYWQQQLPHGPGADQSTRHFLRVNFLPALASSPTSTVLGVAPGKVGPGGEKPEDTIPGGLTKGAIYSANPVFDGPRRGYFTWADVDGQAMTPPGWVTVSGRVLSALPVQSAQPAPDMSGARSPRPYVAPLGETPSQAHASGRWQIEHALGHRLGPAGPGVDLGAGVSTEAGSIADVTSVVASALDGSAIVEPPGSPISVAQCARGLVFPPIPNVTAWQGPVPTWLQTWATAQLHYGIGTVVRDTVGGVPVVGRIECHTYYGGQPNRPATPHKGTTLYQPTSATAAPYGQAPAAPAAKAGGGKARRAAPAVAPTPAQPDAPLDAPPPEDAPTAPAPADPVPDAPLAEGLQDPPEDLELKNGLRASASTSGVSPDPDLGAGRTLHAPTQAPGKVNSPSGTHHDPNKLPNGQPLPPGAYYADDGVVKPKSGYTPPWPGAHWSPQSGTWIGGQQPGVGGTPPSPGAVWNPKIGAYVDGPGSQPAGGALPSYPPGGGSTPPGGGPQGNYKAFLAGQAQANQQPQGGYPSGGQSGQSYSYPGDGGYGALPPSGIDPGALLGLLQQAVANGAPSPPVSGGVDPSAVLALLAQQQQAGAPAPDLAATLQGYLDQGGDPAALAALLQSQTPADVSPDMGAASSPSHGGSTRYVSQRVTSPHGQQTPGALSPSSQAHTNYWKGYADAWSIPLSDFPPGPVPAPWWNTSQSYRNGYEAGAADKKAGKPQKSGSSPDMGAAFDAILDSPDMGGPSSLIIAAPNADGTAAQPFDEAKQAPTALQRVLAALDLGAAGDLGFASDRDVSPHAPPLRTPRPAGAGPYLPGTRGTLNGAIVWVDDAGEARTGPISDGWVNAEAIVHRGILPAWLAGDVDPVTWVPLNVGGYQLQVMSEPASVQGYRLPTSLDDLVAMGAHVDGGAIPITTAISDARWSQAAEQISGAQWHTTDSRGERGIYPPQILEYNAHLPAPSSVLRDGYGKEPVIGPTLKPEGAGSMLQYGWRQPGGAVVQHGMQGPHNHDRRYAGYSDLGTLVKRAAVDPQGNPVDLLDVLSGDSPLSPALKPWLIERLRNGGGGGGIGA